MYQTKTGTQAARPQGLIISAWIIHFLQDVLIFGFMAAGSITPGG
jgi:hypothetical protein